MRLNKNKIVFDVSKLQHNVARLKDNFTSFFDKTLFQVQLKKFGNNIRKLFHPSCTAYWKGNSTVGFILILLVN